jgi:hypothetical protein
MVGNTAILQIEVQCSPSDARERVDNCYECSAYMYRRDYFAGLRVTKRNKATVLLTLTIFQTPTLTLLQVCF